MNDVQMVYLELIDEIGNICTSLGIPYWISRRTALYAYVKHELPDSRFSPSVMVRVGDCKAFRDEVIRRNQPNRKIESMLDNPRYPSFTMRYINTATLRYNIREQGIYQHPGIYISVEFIEDVPGKLAWTVEQGLKWGWFENSKPFSRGTSLKRKAQLARKALAPAVRLSRNAAKKAVFDSLLLLSTHPTGSYQVTCEDLRRIKLNPKWVNNRPYFVNVEGRSLPMMSPPSEYLKRIYGASYALKARRAQTLSNSIIVDTKISASDFLADNSDLTEDSGFPAIVEQNNYLARLNSRNLTEMSSKWKLALKVGEKTSLAERYDDESEQLDNLYESAEYDSLYQRLKPYITHVKSAVSMNVSPFHDERLYDLCESTLKSVEADAELASFTAARKQTKLMLH